MRSIRGGSPQALRQRNKRVLIERLLEVPEGLTRPELARSLELTVPAVSGLVSGNGESLAAIVELCDELPAHLRAGRSANSGPAPKVIRLRPRLGYVIGIDLSHTSIQVALADLYGMYDGAIDTHVAPWEVERDLHGALAYATSAAHQLVEKHGVVAEQIAGIGLAIAAPVNALTHGHPSERTGRLRVDLGGQPSLWSNIDPLAALINHLAALPNGASWTAIPLHIDNDANLGALAELKNGAARGKRNVLYVHLDEAGVGAGLIFEGQVYRGAGGVAGELGHVVVNPNGSSICTRCSRPCLEAELLAILGYHVASQRKPLRDLVDAALAGDPGARTSITDAAEYLGTALAGFATLLNFDRIVVGGPFPPQAYGLVIPPMQTALARLVITPAAKDFVIQLGACGEQAVLEGAIWLALERTRVDYLLHCAARGEPATGAEASTSSPSGTPAKPSLAAATS